MRADATALENPLSLAAIRHRLATGIVGRRLELYDAVPSTNAALRELARAGAPEGTVVLAETQTAGRGRAGKTWFYAHSRQPASTMPGVEIPYEPSLRHPRDGPLGPGSGGRLSGVAPGAPVAVGGGPRLTQQGL